MNREELLALAHRLIAGGVSPDEFAARADRDGSPPRTQTARLPTATIDLDRRRRCGFPEVVYGEGKSPIVLRQIIAALVERGEDVLATRISPAAAAELTVAFPGASYNELGRTFRIAEHRSASRNRKSAMPHVAVITAGTSDLPVAEEARETLDWMGVRTTMVHDVGVAGPHRLPERLAEFKDADAIVVVAGMEGALPSIVGGCVACPVIAVPTSVGYGANFGGVSALLSMLNSCAANVAVVNIDAGFKGGYLAGLIATRRLAAALAPD
ncbi:MAG TPA: nickel pincer cofactor biosynthesis protein LarB, partial [Dongiaceae bacterium]